MNKASRTEAMGRKKAADWRHLLSLSLAGLVVSPERTAWILARYPPTEMGRPGIMYSPMRGEKQKKHSPVPDDERETPAEASDAWRVTHEFAGEEESLGEEESAVAAD